jgi:predicted acetyltransferase
VAYEIREITKDNLPELHRVASTAFGEEPKQERIDDEHLVIEFDRMIGVADGDQLVASAGAYSFELTVPGGNAVPMAGVTWVACLPSHRRRGILRKMMKFQLDDVARRGEPLAGLTASEAVIYGRFGYGVASQWIEAKVRNAHTAFAVEPKASGRIRMVWDDEKAKVLPPIFDEWRRQRCGSVDRSDGRWEQILRDRPFDRGGASAMYHAVHEDKRGVPDGYVAYRIKQGADDGDATGIVREVIAIDPEVEAALWRFVLDVDLVDRYLLRILPVDSQLAWRLADPRALHTVGVWDFLWLRVMHTPAALTARTYATDDSLVLEIVDPFRPRGAAAGRFRLDGGPDGATCAKEKSARADLTMPVEALGSAYLGGVKWSTLAAAGRVTGTPDALRRADAMFASTPLPFCSTGF